MSFGFIVKQEAHWTVLPVTIFVTYFFPPNGITDTKSFEGFSQKGTFSMSSLQQIKSINKKRLNIKTFSMTHSNRNK